MIHDKRTDQNEGYEEILTEFVRQLTHLAETTRNTYAHALKQFFHWLNGSGGSHDHITRVDVSMYISQLSRTKSARTVQKSFAAIKAYCDLTRQQNALQGVQRPKVSAKATAPKSLEHKEQLRILRQVDALPARSRAIIYLLLYSGVRIGELIGLDTNDVTISPYKNGLRGSMRVHGKGARERMIPLPHDACVALQEWLSQRPEIPNESALFVSNYRRRMDVRSAQRVCQKFSTHAHAFRHTYLTQLVRSGVDIVTVAQLAGHQSVSTTQHYTRPREQDLLDAIDRAFS